MKIIWTITILFAITSNGRTEFCDGKLRANISDGVHPDGDVSHKGVWYPKYEHSTRDNTTSGKCMCKDTCAAKCCPFGYGLLLPNKTCVPVPDAYDPEVWAMSTDNANASEEFYYIHGLPTCKGEGETRVLISHANPDYYNYDKDGNLYVEVKASIPPFMVLTPDKYCLDTFVSEDVNGAIQRKLDALICLKPPAEQDQHHYGLSSTCMLISCVFIVATVAVYSWLPELRNLHGRVLMSYLLCLLVAFVFLATMQIMLLLDNIGDNYCFISTIIIYFSLESAFFWLNVMCFDIWWTFSGKGGMTIDKLSVRGKFCAYCVYAFGMPTILTIILLIMQFAKLPEHMLLPHIVKNGCFLTGNSRLLYLYGPIVVLWFANLVFFLLTAVKIAQIKKQTAVLKSRESATHDRHSSEKQRLVLYVKLFLVMGVNWLLEVISSLYPEYDNFWRIIDAYNVLIGLIIFIIFVCKKKIFRLMKKRIKEGIQQRKGAMESVTNVPFRDHVIKNFRDYKQRDSLDTIRTCCPDSDSNKAIDTTNL